MKTIYGLVLFFFILSLNTQAQEAPCSQPFLWGVANSAFQVEGHPADSDFLRWSLIPGNISDGTNALIATDFWNRYDEDFKLAEDLGSNAFRMSIAWERIERERDHWDEEAMAHYENMIVDMRRHGLEPVVTLLHSTLPVWMAAKGGTSGKTFPKEFAKFMYHVVARLGGGPAHVKYWITMNEPTTYAKGIYIDRAKTFLEKLNAPRLFLNSLKGQVRGHIAGVRLVRTLPFEVKIGFAQDWQPFQTYHRHRIPEEIIAGVGASVYDRFFTDGVIKGRSMGGLFRYNIKGVKTVDFVGLNYYTRQIVDVSYIPPSLGLVEGDGFKADNGMEIYPHGIEIALFDAQKRYHLPMLITESGMADEDQHDVRRIALLNQTLAALEHARANGANVFGYLHWSLTDNFEWEAGFSQHYGLMRIEPVTLNRIPRDSYDVYKQIIQHYKNSCEIPTSSQM